MCASVIDYDFLCVQSLLFIGTSYIAATYVCVLLLITLYFNLSDSFCNISCCS